MFKYDDIMNIIMIMIEIAKYDFKSNTKPT